MMNTITRTAIRGHDEGAGVVPLVTLVESFGIYSSTAFEPRLRCSVDLRLWGERPRTTVFVGSIILPYRVMRFLVVV